jgi:hypothetical protein
LATRCAALHSSSSTRIARNGFLPSPRMAAT